MPIEDLIVQCEKLSTTIHVVEKAGNMDPAMQISIDEMRAQLSFLQMQIEDFAITQRTAARIAAVMPLGFSAYQNPRRAPTGGGFGEKSGEWRVPSPCAQ